jgi:hypothetical protein
MARTSETIRGIAIAGLLVGLAGGGAALAQTATPKGPTSQEDNIADSKGQGMMGGGLQEKMVRMVDSCNRMMESLAPPANKG